MQTYQEQVLALLKQIEENTRSKSKPKQSKPFQKPTLEEVKAYIQEHNSQVDPDAFFNHYEANNWYRGKTKIKDWRACVRIWEKSSNKPRVEKI